MLTTAEPGTQPHFLQPQASSSSEPAPLAPFLPAGLLAREDLFSSSQALNPISKPTVPYFGPWVFYLPARCRL